MRKLELGIPSIVFVGLLFWLLMLRPAFMRPAIQAFQSFLERLIR